MNWKGVMPEITSSFNQDFKSDHCFIASHCRSLLYNGYIGIVAGSPRVRPPWLQLIGGELTNIRQIIRQALQNCPQTESSYALPHRK